MTSEKVCIFKLGSADTQLKPKLPERCIKKSCKGSFKDEVPEKFKRCFVELIDLGGK
jgi:hypothetical protein